MKVVCGWSQLEPATREALDNCGHPVTYEYVGHSDTAYPEMIARLFSEGNAFLNVEHDVVPDKACLRAMVRCHEPFCAAPYEWTTNVGPALGCTKFSGDFLADFPTAAAEALGGSFRQFDYVLMRTVLAGKYRQRPHVHLPPAEHLNPAQQLVAPFDELSLEDHLGALGWVLDDGGKTASYRGGAYG